MLMTKEQFKKELTEILDKEYDAKPSSAPRTAQKIYLRQDKSRKQKGLLSQHGIFDGPFPQKQHIQPWYSQSGYRCFEGYGNRHSGHLCL